MLAPTIDYIELFYVGATIGRPQFRNEIQVFGQSERERFSRSLLVYIYVSILLSLQAFSVLQ